MTTNKECLRISDQLRRAFTGDPWHGSPLQVLLTGISAEQALAHPLPSAHNIWELVAHIDIYVLLASGAIEGVPMARMFGTGDDWPPIQSNGPEAWASVTAKLFEDGEALAAAIQVFPDERLSGIVPGRDYDFYYLFHGIVQHSLYHGGQIAMLKQALPEQAV